MIIKKIHSTESKETNSTSKCYSLVNFTWLLSWDGLITHTLVLYEDNKFTMKVINYSSYF